MLLSAQFEGEPMPKKKPEAPIPAISLPELRQRIDSVDKQIQDLIAERAGYARQVGVAKGPLKQAIDYYRPEREAQVLRAAADRNAGPLSNEELLRVFREIMSACLAQQNPLKIAYLGPEGTFSQAAVQKHFGHSVITIPMASIEEVFGEVENGNADFGVVPVENSTEGAVHHTFDMFLTTPLKICGEIELRVHQNLLSRAVDMSQIERVYSHAQSLAQCRSWLRRNLPKAEKIAVSSNAEAARRARNAEDAAAIAGLSFAATWLSRGSNGPVRAMPAPSTASCRTRMGWMALRKSSSGLKSRRIRSASAQSPRRMAASIAWDNRGAMHTQPLVNPPSPKSRRWTMAGCSPMPLMILRGSTTWMSRRK